MESTGFSPDAIIDLLKNSGIAHSIQEDLKPETFYTAAQELNILDNRRGSWTNEDPNWESVARELDIADVVTSVIGAVTYARRKVEPEEPEIDNIMPPPPVSSGWWTSRGRELSPFFLVSHTNSLFEYYCPRTQMHQVLSRTPFICL